MQLTRSIGSLRALTGLALAGAALTFCAPHAQAATPACQKALDDAQVAERNFETVSKDPNTSAEDKKRAEDEANMTASTAQRLCDSTDPAVTATPTPAPTRTAPAVGPVRGGVGGSQDGTATTEIVAGTALLAAGALGTVLVMRRRAAADRS